MLYEYKAGKSRPVHIAALHASLPIRLPDQDQLLSGLDVLSDLFVLFADFIHCRVEFLRDFPQSISRLYTISHDSGDTPHFLRVIINQLRVLKERAAARGGTRGGTAKETVYGEGRP